MRGTTTTRTGPVRNGCVQRQRRPRCRRHSHTAWTKRGGLDIGLIDQTGVRRATYTYDPYGTTLTATGSSAAANPWRYTAGHSDPTGLVKFGTRYYDPATGRWTQQDAIAGTIANPGTINRYAYVGGDPVNRVDPSGRNFLTDLIEEGGSWLDAIDVGRLWDSAANGSENDFKSVVAGVVGGIFPRAFASPQRPELRGSCREER